MSGALSYAWENVDLVIHMFCILIIHTEYPYEYMVIVYKCYFEKMDNFTSYIKQSSI